MERSTVFSPLMFLVVCAALFIWFTSDSLPATVASHFGASGMANGFMPRAFYVRFMLTLTVLLPLGLTSLTNLTLRISETRLNLPNREYWLAPERRDETVEYLRQQNVRFGYMLAVFLCYVHWLVLRANAVTPPTLSTPGIVAGLIVFAVSVIFWSINFIGHFRNVPR